MSVREPSTEPAEARAPAAIARLVENAGVAKANLDTLSLLALSILAGAYISIGAMLFLVITSGAGQVWGPVRWLGGMGFSLGLILVIVAGAELFTGNNLIAMAWASRRVLTGQLLRNWGLVYCGNVAGCLATVLLVLWAGLPDLGGGSVRETAIQVATAKADLGAGAVLARGVLCNALVCIAVWLAMGGRSVADRILAIVFPVSAFVALGLEHSIANWFFLPLGMALVEPGTIPAAGVIRNLVLSTLGNVAGGTLLVAGIYWFIYLRPSSRAGAVGDGL